MIQKPTTQDIPAGMYAIIRCAPIDASYPFTSLFDMPLYSAPATEQQVDNFQQWIGRYMDKNEIPGSVEEVFNTIRSVEMKGRFESISGRDLQNLMNDHIERAFGEIDQCIAKLKNAA